MGNNLKSVAETAHEAMGADGDWDARYNAIYLALQAREDDRAYAYHERNELVAFLSRLYPSHLMMHPASDETWDREWMTIVCVHGGKARLKPAITVESPYEELPEVEDAFEYEEFQMTWHIHDSELSLFDHLEMRDNDWDGHTTDEKYQRLRRLP